MVGVIVARSGEGWRVDIGSANFASLDGLAFEGATKRSRPNLKVAVQIHPLTSLKLNNRWDLSFTQEFHWRTKIWNQNWNALMHEHANQGVSANSKGVLWSVVA